MIGVVLIFPEESSPQEEIIADLKTKFFLGDSLYPDSGAAVGSVLDLVIGDRTWNRCLIVSVLPSLAKG